MSLRIGGHRQALIGSATSISVVSGELLKIQRDGPRSRCLIRRFSVGAIASHPGFMTTAVAILVLIAGRARASDAAELANLFADCSGVWQAVSIMESRIGKPISAERYAGLARAASASASYILAVDRGAEDLRQFGADVEPRESEARLQMLALIDRRDGTRVDQWMSTCAATLETQTEIVQLIQDYQYDRK